MRDYPSERALEDYCRYQGHQTVLNDIRRRRHHAKRLDVPKPRTAPMGGMGLA